jgi:hypothetical protein
MFACIWEKGLLNDVRVVTTSSMYVYRSASQPVATQPAGYVHS